MKKFLIIFTLFIYSTITFGQAPATRLSMITCFSQGHHGSGATNCASVSTIKLAITKYGIKVVFLKIDTLQANYIIHLRNGKQTELTQDEIATMENLNKFWYEIESDTVKAAKFMYAVMAKNKFSDPEYHCKSLLKAATESSGLFGLGGTVYQLNEDTWDNLELLGMDTTKIQKINVTNIQNYPDIIITSSKHSVYASSGTYDEYGTPTPLALFSQEHREINQNMNYILID